MISVDVVLMLHINDFDHLMFVGPLIELLFNLVTLKDFDFVRGSDYQFTNFPSLKFFF